MKNNRISSPDTDRKIAWFASVVFMILAWLFLVGFLAFAFIAGRPATWGFLEYGAVGIAFLALLFIPFQLLRYLREKRTSR